MISPPHCIVHTHARHDNTSRRAGSSLPIINFRGGGCMHGTNMIKLAPLAAFLHFPATRPRLEPPGYVLESCPRTGCRPPATRHRRPGDHRLFTQPSPKALCGAHLLSLAEWHTSRHCSRFRQTFALTAPVGQPQIDPDPAIVWMVHYTALVSDGMSISACHH